MRSVSTLDSLETAPAGLTPPTARRGSSLAAMRALYVLSLRQHLHGKRWMITAVLFLIPAALAMVVRATAPDAPPRGLEFVFVFLFVPQALLPLVALIYASGMIPDEQEEQTLTYLLMRPIPRWGIYVVKLLATLTTTIILTALFTSLMYLAIYANSATPQHGIIQRCVKAIGIHALAVTAYCSLFGLMSLFTRRALLMGILYSVIFEGFLANLPLSVRLITVIYYARIIAYRSLSFVVEMPRSKVDMAAEIWRIDIANDPDLTEHPTFRACMLVLLGASVVMTLLAAFICSRREFYVKTPEKS